MKPRLRNSAERRKTQFKMQSLTLKIFTDFNPRSRRCWVSSRKSRYDGRAFKIVACSWEKNEDGKKKQTQSSFPSRSQTYALLKQQMHVAAKSEVSLYFNLYCIYILWVFGFFSCWGRYLAGLDPFCLSGVGVNILELVWSF